MAITLRAGAEDLLRCRFVVSPLWELVHAVRLLRDRRSQRWHLRWLDEAGPSVPVEAAALLLALTPPHGFTPDFLAPPPRGRSIGIDAELALVRATPTEDVARELRLCRADQPTPERALLDGLLADPASARSRIADAQLACWDALLRPWWPRVSALLEADIARRAAQLAEHGLAAVLDDLHEKVSWTGEAVVVRSGAVAAERDLAGVGLVLMPSAFAWPDPLVITDEPWQPTIAYPARGVGALWERSRSEPSAALARLLGPTRALLLSDLGEPASTTALARRHGLAASTVSAHLAALADAGLAAARRERRTVLYRRTPLGAAVCEGDLPG